MILLNEEQQEAVEFKGNVVVTACPGSGKTRVLTARVIRALGELASFRERVIAVTYTNRAADEIQARLDLANVDTECLWAGTIHSFALEWILRPYAPYSDELKNGFSIASEFYADQLLEELKTNAGMGVFDEVSPHLSRGGAQINRTDQARMVFDQYKATLRENNLIDYDDLLYPGYKLVTDIPEVAQTLSSIIRVVCVDEVQDIQDLQYGILSAISRAASSPVTLFFVGDENQSIYESLGAMTKAPEEIATEFGLTEIGHLELKGNYRSTQRIIDLYRQLRPIVPPIESRASYAAEPGIVTFDDQTVALDDLSSVIAGRIAAAIADGVPTHEICVVAPQWTQVRAIARRLVNELPEVDFDAPGLSPLHSSRENFWFKVARLLLTVPSPKRTRTRMRWAKEALADLCAIAKVSLPELIGTPRRLLRVLNSLSSPETDGLAYLRDAFRQFLSAIQLDVEACIALKVAYEGFFGKAENHLANASDALPTDVDSFRRLFSHPAGVVVSTCHGVKGEEYETVIAFGLLRGYVPHWSAVFGGDDDLATDMESKLLYVICSRAKRRLHLISEYGRQTKKKKPYETSYLLASLEFEFDAARGRDWK
jgi:DNA helicase II / ATP-dependent DNA helicase PcrA